ncbi:hypothetical protein RB195_004868 [Necator americanus]|uniref:G-patch domain-containing protein n=1 Tax=Necator americanus TaxID=51031 RepID=A0ABR1BNF2_NECAM
MSILAGPRRKQRLSVDPRNLQWKNDEKKFSQKLMEKMGWSEGDGLGKNRQGNADSVKLKANYTGKGLGADKLASYDSTWIAHHDDFADLLSALNKNKEENGATEEEKEERAKKISLELSSKSLRRRIHYQKFTRAKDVSNYTEKDRSAVLGLGLSRVKQESPKKEESKVEPLKEEEGSNDVPKTNTTVSKLSVGEYFAAKMAALNARRGKVESEANVDVDVKVGESEITCEARRLETREERKERKKRKKEAKIRQESLQCVASAETFEMEIEVSKEEEVDEKEKRKRKKRKNALELSLENEETGMERDSTRTKIFEDDAGKNASGVFVKNKKRKMEKQDLEDEDEPFEDELMKSNKKVKKDRKNESKKKQEGE